jgi:tetratricopeptide (TPR) repeat protein
MRHIDRNDDIVRPVERIRGWFGLKPPQRPETQRLRETLEAGRRAKFAEEYDRALELFARAVEVAQEGRDSAAVVVVALHEAEVLIRLERWDDAERLLASLEHTARLSNESVHLAYIACASGTLKQARGDWAGARTLYEQALSTARDAHSVGAEGRALGHLGDTYLHDSNASYATHLLKDALPKLNASGDIELSSFFVGLLGQAMIQSGQEIEGQHLLERALQLAEQIHFRLYERHWALVLAERAYSEARYHDAYAHYAHALRLFPTDPPSAEHVTALCLMSQVCLSLRDNHQALTYAEQAVTLGERISEPLAAKAWGAMGSALRALGRSAEAIPFLTAASDAYARLDGTTVDQVEIETLRSLAAAMVDAHDPAAGDTYRRAVEKAEKLNRPLEVAQIRRDRGLMYARAGDKAQALQDWSAALAIYEENKHPAQVARLYTDIAAARRGLGQGPRALKDYEHALMAVNSVDEHDYETRGVVLANAATVFAEQGDIDSADSFFTESITMAEKLGDSTAESTRRGNYGLFLLTIGRPRRALAMLEQALQISRSHNLALQTAVQTSNIGLGYDAVGSYPEALDHHRQALDLIRPLEATRWQQYIAVNHANTLMMLAQYEDARPEIEQAVQSMRAAGDTEILIAALTAHTRLVIAQHTPEPALAWIDEAISLARRYDYRRLLAEALSVKSELLAALQREDESAAVWDEALKFYVMLRMPQGKSQPVWLTRGSVKP